MELDRKEEDPGPVGVVDPAAPARGEVAVAEGAAAGPPAVVEVAADRDEGLVAAPAVARAQVVAGDRDVEAAAAAAGEAVAEVAARERSLRC